MSNRKLSRSNIIKTYHNSKERSRITSLQTKKSWQKDMLKKTEQNCWYTVSKWGIEWMMHDVKTGPRKWESEKLKHEETDSKVD